MLELPESHVIARQIKETLSAKTIETVIAAQSPHGFGWYQGDPKDYPNLLCGKTITDAQPSGGQVELFVENLRLVFNDGVNIRYYAPDIPLPPKHQLLLTFDDGSSLVCTVQMYGGMMAFAAGTNDNFYYLVGKQKPTPFEDSFDLPYFLALAGDAPGKLSVKALLATEQRIPGLGNGCLQDILFHAGIHPQSKLARLDEADLTRLFTQLKQTLRAMRDGGGRDTEKDFFGNPGGYRTVLSSKTLAYPCPACGGGIIRKAYLGGNVYFCAHCQPLLK